MKSLLATLALLALVGCGESDLPAEDPQMITWRTILADVAVFDSSRLGPSRLFSSSAAPVSMTGFAPKTFGDLDHGNFLDVRDVEGGVEATLAEMVGTGAITWIWSANPAGTLILEIDGVSTEVSFAELMRGDWLPTAWPCAAKTAGGWNLHFPMLHQHHCKVSVRAKSRAELGTLFYQIAWNQVEGMVEPFDLRSPRIHKKKLKELSRQWTEYNFLEIEPGYRGGVASRRESEVMHLEGSGVITTLVVSAASKADLAELSIVFYWDGAGEVDCGFSAPLHMLCGVSEAFEDTESLPISVRGATAIIRWPMPFGEGVQITMFSTGDASVDVKVSTAVDRSRAPVERLQGAFVCYLDVHLSAEDVVPLFSKVGAGRIVGVVAKVDARSDGWWGEGDPIIWVDGAEQPAWRGTGTEDYFGFAWCSESSFQHPLRSQTRPGMMARYHLLDPIPFEREARFDFEVRGMGDGMVDYSALTLWYSATNSKND